MENLKLTRIDFRLIHGQVMARWSKELNIENIVVIDDRSAKSPILKKILLNAASGVKVEVETVDNAANRWKEGQFPTGNLLILFKDPVTAERAWKAGIDYKALQIGGIEGSAEKKNISRSIVMSKEDVDNLIPLHENGVKIYCQPIPEDGEYPFKSILEKF